MLLGKTIKAVIPPHYVWCIPTQSQRLSIQVYVHGCPVEVFSHSCPIDQAEDKVAAILRHQREGVASGRTASLTTAQPVYSSEPINLLMPAIETVTSKIVCTYHGSSLNEHPMLFWYAPVCEKYVRRFWCAPV